MGSPSGAWSVQGWNIQPTGSKSDVFPLLALFCLGLDAGIMSVSQVTQVPLSTSVTPQPCFPFSLFGFDLTRQRRHLLPVASPLGPTLVASTGTGITAVGWHPQPVVHSLLPTVSPAIGWTTSG